MTRRDPIEKRADKLAYMRAYYRRRKVHYLAYNRRPDVKEKRRAYNHRPEVRAKGAAWHRNRRRRRNIAPHHSLGRTPGLVGARPTSIDDRRTA